MNGRTTMKLKKETQSFLFILRSTEKVGQALRDAIKTRRALEKKNALKGKTPVVNNNGLRNMIDEQIVRFPITKTEQPSNTATPSTTNPDNSLTRQEALLHPFFHQELTADLEPTPIGTKDLNLPADVFDRSNIAHARSETSASTLLRLFDEAPSSSRRNSNDGQIRDQARRLSLSQMSFHPVEMASVKNDFKFFFD